MDVLSTVGSLFTNLFTFLSSSNQTQEEIEKLRTDLSAAQVQVVSQIVDLQKEALNAQADILKSETANGGWLQKNWRPITMLTFLVLIVLDSFGLLSTPIAPQMWSLIQLGMGGYVVGRSFEKVVPSVMNTISGGNKNG